MKNIIFVLFALVIIGCSAKTDASPNVDSLVIDASAVAATTADTPVTAATTADTPTVVASATPAPATDIPTAPATGDSPVFPVTFTVIATAALMLIFSTLSLIVARLTKGKLQ